MLACITALFVFLKFLFNIHFSDFGFGFYLAVILTAGLVWVALQTRNESVGDGRQHPRRSASAARSEQVAAAADPCSCHDYAAARSSPLLSAVALIALMCLVPWLSVRAPWGRAQQRQRVDERALPTH